VKRFVLAFLMLALAGCAGATASSRPSTKAGPPAAKLVQLEERARAQEQRVRELEARIALLEQEARAARSTPVKPTETVRIGARRREPDVAHGEPAEARPVIRLHEHREAPEPLALPAPPPGVPTRLAVVPLPGEAAKAMPATKTAPPRHVSAAGEAGDPREDYRAALGLLRARNFEAALAAFEAFVARHPGHALTDNAVYWQGEAHYAERRYREALEQFESLVAHYPRSNKLADALLKIGLCHRRLGDGERAAQYFHRVREQYPNSDAARIASREGSS
jgi:tol-pal system protein YbgF